MNRHLSIITCVALSLTSGLASAQGATSVEEAQRQVEQAQQQADQAQQRAEQARREADQARRDAEQARKAADQARRQAQKQAQEDARVQAKGRAQGAPSSEGRVYAPGPFDNVEVDGAGQVRIVQADRDEVFVPGNENGQEDVDVQLSGNRMHIDLPGGWKFWKSGNGALVEVRLRHLARLTLSGSNDVFAPGPISGDQLTVSMAGSGLARFDQLQVGRLNFDISGAGEGQLSGKVDQLRLSVSGKGKIGAEQLRTGSADVSISGVGNASLWTVGELRVQISGAGHVDYWGQPSVKKSISGFGSVDARGDKK